MSFTPQQVSEMLDLPSSTLRRYSELYAPALSPLAQGNGKKRKYDDLDILKLKRIKELTRERKTPEEIRAAIETEVIEPKPETPPSALALVPEILAGFEHISAQLAKMGSDRESDRQTMSRLESEMERLAHELEEQRRPWWDRLRSRFRRDQET